MKKRIALLPLLFFILIISALKVSAVAVKLDHEEHPLTMQAFPCVTRIDANTICEESSWNCLDPTKIEFENLGDPIKKATSLKIYAIASSQGSRSKIFKGTITELLKWKPTFNPGDSMLVLIFESPVAIGVEDIPKISMGVSPAM